jgi:hypothetical protein
MPPRAAAGTPKEGRMSVIDDLTTAVEAYPKSNVQIHIEDVEFPGDVLNVDEEGSFKVRVTNNGSLNLTDVTVKIKGLNGALVRVGPPIVGFSEESEANVNDVAGDGGSVLTPAFFFQAPEKPSASPEDLFKVTLHDWNANLDRILNDHTDPVGTVNDVFTTEVANL